jgi:cytochrome c biogenesis protein CcdA
MLRKILYVVAGVIVGHTLGGMLGGLLGLAWIQVTKPTLMTADPDAGFGVVLGFALVFTVVGLLAGAWIGLREANRQSVPSRS